MSSRNRAARSWWPLGAPGGLPGFAPLSLSLARLSCHEHHYTEAFRGKPARAAYEGKRRALAWKRNSGGDNNNNNNSNNNDNDNTAINDGGIRGSSSVRIDRWADSKPRARDDKSPTLPC
jgi:hypothetical protein